MAAPRRKQEVQAPRRPPAKTPEERENQMIALAVDLAELQLREGTATTPLINHYLKLATTRERLEQEKLRHENALLEARKEALESGQRLEALYGDAIKAMHSYQGREVEDFDDPENLY